MEKIAIKWKDCTIASGNLPKITTIYEIATITSRECVKNQIAITIWTSFYLKLKFSPKLLILWFSRGCLLRNRTIKVTMDLARSYCQTKPFENNEQNSYIFFLLSWTCCGSQIGVILLTMCEWNGEFWGIVCEWWGADVEKYWKTRGNRNLETT